MVGVIGSDVLRRCVLEICAANRVPGSGTPGKLTANLYDPTAYAAPPRVQVRSAIRMFCFRIFTNFLF